MLPFRWWPCSSSSALSPGSGSTGEFLNWKVAAWFSAGSTPFAVLGSFLFISTNTDLLTRIMGAGMIALVVLTQLPWSRRVRMRLWGFLPLGASAGFLGSVFGIPGPFAPVFHLAYGLSSREYVATFSLGMLLIQVPKLAIYGGGGELLTTLVLGLGLTLGVIAIAGSYFGAQMLRRVPDKYYAAAINAIVAGFGVLFLATGG